MSGGFDPPEPPPLIEDAPASDPVVLSPLSHTQDWMEEVHERRPGPIALAAWVLFFGANLVLAIYPFVGYLLGDPSAKPVAGMLDDPAMVAASIAGSWLLFAVAAVLARTAHLTWRDLGLVGLPPKRLLIWTAITLGGLLVTWAAAGLLGADKLDVVEPITRAPRGLGGWLLWTGLAVSAGITEEFTIRGYGIGFWIKRGANRWAAAVAVSLLFGAMHLYQGVHATIVLAIWGFVFAFSYLRTGSILPGIIAHALVDGLAPLFI